MICRSSNPTPSMPAPASWVHAAERPARRSLVPPGGDLPGAGRNFTDIGIIDGRANPAGQDAGDETVRHVPISEVRHYLPGNIRTNDDLERQVETTDAWIFAKTGIRQRHLADPSDASPGLALHAARRALESAGRRAVEVRLIVLATSSPDPIALVDACGAGKLKAGDRVAFVRVGGGLPWGSTVFRWMPGGAVGRWSA